MSHPERRREYLVTTSAGNVERKLVWREGEVLGLDYAGAWSLARIDNKICVFDKSLGDPELIEANAFFADDIANGEKIIVELPSSSKGSRPLDVTLTPLVPLKAPYMQQFRESYANPNVPRQLMLYHGMRYVLMKYRPVGPKFTAGYGGEPAFSYVQNLTEFVVTSKRSGLFYKLKGQRYPIPQGQSVTVKPADFFSMVIIHDVYWWRFRSVQTPESMPPIETDDSEQDFIEQKRFENSAISVVVALASLLLFMLVFRKQLDPPKHETVVVSLAPKAIPHEDMFKPTPAPTAVPTPPPVVAKATPEPKPVPPSKVAEKPKIKEKPVKVAKAKKAPAPAPAPIVARAKPLKSKAEPPPMVKADTPPATGVVVAKTESPAAAQNAKALEALSFLSSNSKAPSRGGVTYSNSSKKDFMVSPTLGGGSKDSKVLDTMSSAAGDSNIKTKSSRQVASDVKFAGKGKGLNAVEGKVSSNEIYGRGSVGGLSGVASGISVSGPGNLSEAEIEKALQKYLSKFQFCYEKSLISDSSLGGNLRLQWTIETSGHVSGGKVIQSQMNNPSLHACILGVLKTVPFPSPKGGSVIAKKTFNFKSSAL